MPRPAVLCVEPDPEAFAFVAAILDGHGLDTVNITTGEAALDWCRSHQPALIILSVEPRKVGYAICNKLKRSDDLRLIPLILTSAEETPQTFEQHKKLSCRAEEYLLKPFTDEELMSKVIRVLGDSTSVASPLGARAPLAATAPARESSALGAFAEADDTVRETLDGRDDTVRDTTFQASDAALDELAKGLDTIGAPAADYQVFLSFKSADERGWPTRDSILARLIYDGLSSAGIAVFMSTVELERIGRADFKRAIDEALDAAKVLVVVGTSRENLNSHWVRYEWDSFFHDTLDGSKPDAQVLAYVEGLRPRDLPRTLRTVQVVEHNRDSDESLRRICSFIRNALDRLAG